jgi:alkylation response protein AidB-like acyl-CoA dehydrogenase
MGAQGWLEPEAKSAKEGGLTAVQRRIWNLERRRAKLPLETWGGTLMILRAVRRFGSAELLDEVMPGVYGGAVRFAMGYTEPEGGSDIATCKTRADGWTVLNGPLSAEHGSDGPDPAGLADIATMGSFGAAMADAADAVASQANLSDGSATYRLGRAHARIETALSTPGIFGRVAIAQTMRDIAPDLMDVLGTASALPSRVAGSVGATEYLYRWAPLVGIYGGTIDVFRNMIAQHVLGLGRPNYSPPK